METTRAVVLHPAMFRTPWHVAFLVAAAELVKYSALTAAVVIGGTVAVVLVLLLALLAAPLCAAIVAWIVWRSAEQGARAGRRLARRARRRMRVLGLRVVQGARA
jgi:hypothetical protein